jgi:hypothetical protein
MKKTGIAVVVAIAVALSCLFLLLSSSMHVPALAQEQADELKPDLMITAIKPYHYEWYEEYDIPKGKPWFNLKSYVNVTVRNNGTAAARSFEVKLYADDELIGSVKCQRRMRRTMNSQKSRKSCGTAIRLINHWRIMCTVR